ncbi:MAG: radical SAM protein [Bacteroidales bacterium]|nr:radical SAM protein [Bacteroidales bacterium]
MKILLINPPQENSMQAGIEDDFIDIIGYYPPLGLMYIATILNNQGFETKIIDCVPMKVGYNELKNKISDFKPDVVGISTYTMSMVDVLLTVNLVKELHKDVIVVLGGHHVQLYPLLSINYDNVDFILRGEADYTFLELINAIKNQIPIDKFEKIEGIGFKNRDKEFIHPRIAMVKDLNNLPIPDRTLLPKDIYQSIVGRNNMVATVMSSRGCPYKCTFCYTPSKLYRSRTTENILDEVKYLKSQSYKEIFFFDDLFALKPSKVIDFSKALRLENIKIDWSFRGRINTVTEEMINEAAKSGIHRIQFGIEAGVDSTLKRIKKGISTDKITQAIKWCKKAKITTVGNFMIGLPDETEKEINQTLRFSRKVGLNYAQYSILVPYPFTEIYTEALKRGIIKKDFWLEFSKDPIKNKDNFKVEYWTEHVSEEFLFKTIKKSFKLFYFRPISIINKLKEIKTFQEFWFSVKGAFSVLVFSPRIKSIKNDNSLT